MKCENINNHMDKKRSFPNINKDLIKGYQEENNI